MELQVEPDHYFNKSYDSKERFISYWHQIDEAILLKPRRLLEIGVGNGFFSNYLRQKGLKIITLDIDVRLKPDSVGSVLQIPFFDGSFDVVTCYELFEHLQFSAFPKALREIHRVSTNHAIISLPDITTVYRFNIELPRLKPIKKLIPHPFPRQVQNKFEGQHYWEIGKDGYPLQRIERNIKRGGFSILKTYRVFECYYHRFFLLKKL